MGKHGASCSLAYLIDGLERNSINARKGNSYEPHLLEIIIRNVANGRSESQMVGADEWEDNVLGDDLRRKGIAHEAGLPSPAEVSAIKVKSKILIFEGMCENASDEKRHTTNGIIRWNYIEIHVGDTGDGMGVRKKLKAMLSPCFFCFKGA
jgi:hypothetical protein